MTSWQKLFQLAEHDSQLMIGLMSGTSGDGADAALVLFPDANNRSVQLIGWEYLAFSDDLRHRILTVAAGTGNAETISRLSVELAHHYADTVHKLCATTGVSAKEVLAIGCHGQTISHTPDGAFPATLQIGDAATLAHLTGIPVLSGFRNKDVALGGQGAPLVPFADWYLFCHESRSRALQNIGGIANVTYLPVASSLNSVIGFDTGPGNMLIDFAAKWASRGVLAFDVDGALAARGRIDEPLLDWLFEHPFLKREPPKSAGREEFGIDFWNELLVHMRSGPRQQPCQDIVATLTAFTADSIVDAYNRYLPSMPDEVIFSGGGARNPVLMQFVTAKLAPIPVHLSDEWGINAEAREAVAFAILAHETMLGRATNLPSVTGARRTALLGNIALPD